MITIRRAADRGIADFGWLKSYHSFSFGDYFDPHQMGFSTLRVINDDIFVTGSGFPTHSHRDMEIITFVLGGAVAHKDSTGSSGQTGPGEIQVMTAGSGISHSEFAVGSSNCEMLQIWIKPSANSLQPSYRQIHWQKAIDNGLLEPFGGNISDPPKGLHLLCSASGRNGSISLNADADLYYGTVSGELSLRLSSHRSWYLQGLDGSFRYQTDDSSGEGSLRDALGIRWNKSAPGELTLSGQASFLLFDLPM